MLTCENHYSNSNSNTTFLLKRRPSPPSRISGWPHLPEDRENVKSELKHDAKERDVCEQWSMLQTFAYMCYEVS